MITNFEELTIDLTEIELSYKDDIKRYLQSLLTLSYPVKQDDLCVQINYKFQHEHGPSKFSISSARLRKYFNYFRYNGILPLIATSNGCYLSEDPTEIQKQITSLEERARQILRAAEGMKKLLIDKL